MRPIYKSAMSTRHVLANGVSDLELGEQSAAFLVIWWNSAKCTLELVVQDGETGHRRNLA
jgi:hypothetical protein